MTRNAVWEGSEEEAAVRAVVKEVEAAWAENDADAFAALFDEDATLIGDAYMRGREGVRGFMAQGFEGPYKGTGVVVEPLEVRFVREGVALVFTRGRVEIPGVPADTDDLAFFATCVMVRRDGGWLIAAYQNSKATSADL
ncbi:SgcJ/EcaC family oxidoreductase [Nocardiopsis sp. NPDC058789]|uniref:SgcJ/EcaC family oxidoreductase n=1 Tax=Nocardiopsis sp. NPDC058789 TaxID=3346634 RepID=UPI00366D1201